MIVKRGHLRMAIRLIAVLLTICVSGSGVQAQSLDGVWRSEGYGTIFEIQGSTVRTFQVTTTTCIPWFTADRDPSNIAGREATFALAHGDRFFIRTGGTTKHKLLHRYGTASDIRLDRVAVLPATCEHLTPNTPADNFEVFARTWAENYILFDQKKVNWDEIVRANKAKVGPDTTPTQLFDILAGMIEPFHDRHTSISAPDIKRRFETMRPGTDRLTNGNMSEFRAKTMPALWAITDRKYLKAPVRKWCNDQLQYAHVDDHIGYLRIVSFSGYTDEGGFEAGLTALESALDAIFFDPELRALVIDVRVNFGGDDPYGLSIASRLASRKYLAYTKVARSDPVNRNKWTPGDPSIVHPSARPSFRGPVVELIGPLTISAGETFTQALMGRTPHVTRIGENTQGVFSDVLSRKLPNGWGFGLPNEVFRTKQGTTFDAVGVSPDITVPVFADADVADGMDAAMMKALEVLGKQMPSGVTTRH
jgi:Peptidase family S41